MKIRNITECTRVPVYSAISWQEQVTFNEMTMMKKEKCFVNINDISSDERKIFWWFHEITREKVDFKTGMHFCFNFNFSHCKNVYTKESKSQTLNF